MSKPRIVGELHGFPIAVDPDLARDVFWIIDKDGEPLGVGLIPAAAVSDDTGGTK